MKVHWPKRGRYVHIRVRSPRAFIRGSFRTHDIGRPEHSKRIAGRLKGSGKWATQAFLILKKEFNRTAVAKRLLKQIKARYR